MMLNSLYIKIAKWAAAIAGLVALWFGVRQSGRNAERADNANKTLERVKKRDKVRKEISHTDDTAIRDELYKEWSNK